LNRIPRTSKVHAHTESANLSKKSSTKRQPAASWHSLTQDLTGLSRELSVLGDHGDRN
jgi:hypothetical protein